MGKIIAFCGRSGTGKDTAGQLAKEILGEEWEIKKFADPLKHIASILTGVPIEKFEDQEFKKRRMGEEWIGNNGMELTYRDFLQRVGTEAFRYNVCENTWVNALFKDFTPESKWIVTDLRFFNENKAILQNGGITVRVVREGIPKLNHHSETALHHVPTHHIIQNDDGILELRNKVEVILKMEKFI